MQPLKTIKPSQEKAPKFMNVIGPGLQKKLENLLFSKKVVIG